MNTQVETVDVADGVQASIQIDSRPALDRNIAQRNAIK